MLPDTHSHLAAPEFADDRDAVVARALEAGVDRVLVVGSDFATSLQAVECAQQYDGVFAAVGVHPHEAAKFEDEAASVLALLDEPKVVAVGEVGLDRSRAEAPFHAQQTAFRVQLRWAAERSLPVSVHNRDADEDVLEILNTHSGDVILHCFTSQRSIADEALRRGYVLSFAGNLTYPSANSLRETAATVPLSHCLVESDAPVLSPQRWRGRRNEPAYVRATGELLADLHSVPFERLAQEVSELAERVFQWGSA